MTIFQRLAAVSLGLVADILYAAPLGAAELPVFPDSDTEKGCARPGESPECATKTFVMCSDKSVASCKLIGLTIQPDGGQHKDDGTLAGDIWVKPWTVSWTDLLGVSHAGYTVWEIAGLREVAPTLLRDVPLNKRALTGSHEMMIKMVNAKGVAEKQSLFLIERKGVWAATGFATWRGTAAVNACERRKLGSLACRYNVPGLAPW